jgi:pimeloyl-ACP methyl ester carboxylesterase
MTGYAPVNGLNLYYEVHGSGEPLFLLHGGLGAGEMFAGILPLLSGNWQVIAVDLQGHGHTADIARPLSFEAMAGDIAG